MATSAAVGPRVWTAERPLVHAWDRWPSRMNVATAVACALALTVYVTVVASSVFEVVQFVTLGALVLAAAAVVGAFVGDATDRRFVVALAALAVAVRIALGVALFALRPEGDPHLMGNSDTFTRRAWAWIEGGGGWVFAAGLQHPGFYQFLVVAFRAFGATSANSFVAVTFVAFFGALLAPFTYRAAKLLFTPGVAVVAGLMAAVLPEFVFHSSIVIRDQVLAAGFAIALCGVIRAAHVQTPEWLQARGMPPLPTPRKTLNGVLLALAGTLLILFIKATYAFLLIVLVAFVLLGYRSLAKMLLPALPFALLVVSLLLLFQGLNQDFLFLGTSDDAGKALTGGAIADTFNSARLAEGDHPIAQTSAVRAVILALPAIIGVPLELVWGALTPMLPLGGLWEEPATRLAFSLRALGWQIALPFLFIAAWRVVTSARPSYHERLVVGAAVVSLVFPALLTIADTWDGPRYRSTAAPFLAMAIALGWRAQRSFVARNQTRLIAMALGAVNLAYFAASLVRQGYVRAPPLQLDLEAWFWFLVAPVARGYDMTGRLASAGVIIGVFLIAGVWVHRRARRQGAGVAR